MILSKILDGIMDQQGEFEFLEFNVGRKKHDYSSTKIQITGKTREHLDNILGGGAAARRDAAGDP